MQSPLVFKKKFSKTEHDYLYSCKLSTTYISKEENYQQCSNMKMGISQFDKNLDLGIQAFVKTVFIAE